jgi:hypothetical protein
MPPDVLFLWSAIYMTFMVPCLYIREWKDEQRPFMAIAVTFFSAAGWAGFYYCVSRGLQ